MNDWHQFDWKLEWWHCRDWGKFYLPLEVCLLILLFAVSMEVWFFLIVELGLLSFLSSVYSRFQILVYYIVLQVGTWAPGNFSQFFLFIHWFWTLLPATEVFLLHFHAHPECVQLLLQLLNVLEIEFSCLPLVVEDLLWKFSRFLGAGLHPTSFYRVKAILSFPRHSGFWLWLGMFAVFFFFLLT